MTDNACMVLTKELDDLRLRKGVAFRENRFAEVERLLLTEWELIPKLKACGCHDDYEYYRQTTCWRAVEFYRDTKQFEKAFAWMKKLEELYGKDDSSRLFLEGTVYYEYGKKDEAFRIFDLIHKKYGKRPFQGREDEKKYLEFYMQKKLQLHKKQQN